MPLLGSRAEWRPHLEVRPHLEARPHLEVQPRPVVRPRPGGRPDLGGWPQLRPQSMRTSSLPHSFSNRMQTPTKSLLQALALEEHLHPYVCK